LLMTTALIDTIQPFIDDHARKLFADDAGTHLEYVGIILCSRDIFAE
jgi:hypothetical protein